MAKVSLPTRLFLFIFLMFSMLTVSGQNCQVDFPGTSNRTFSGACGGPTVASLELGDNINLSDGDTFTFDLPVVNIFGNLHIDADGNGKIIIPAGVTVNVGGDVQFHNKNSECTSANPCVFEIVVNGTANFTDNVDNDLFTLVWSGTGTVVVGDKFRNSNQGCMDCGSSGCPNIQVDPSDCQDNGSSCAGGNFCTQINACSSDVTAPVITNCPSNQVVNMTGPGCSRRVFWTTPTATDNCVIASFNPSHSSGSIFPKGLTVVTYTATDAAGNTSICSFNINVVDNTPPVITGCPANITVDANAACQAVVSWTVPGFTDNCVGASISTTTPAGSTFNKGTTTVVYTATDASGNTATCSFNVIVEDLTPPVMTGNGDIHWTAGPSCGAKVSFQPPLVEACGAVTITSSHKPGDEFSMGTTEVNYTATNSSGASSTYKFKVIVDDKSGPIFQNCPTNILATANSACVATVEWESPTAIDNCGSITMTSSHNPSNKFPIGKTEVIYAATDSQGNVSTCVFNVIVQNENLPIISNCPTDIALTGNEKNMAIAEWSSPTATAECGEVTLIGSHESGDSFKVGITKVEYRATDDAGNTSYCNFDVIVSPMEIEIGIGKVVTPDGNGKNDEWILTNIEKFSDNNIVVVDRWGGVIFSGRGYNNQTVVWRGTNVAGRPVPTGTYYYTISVRFEGKSLEKSGFIELIR